MASTTAPQEDTKPVSTELQPESTTATEEPPKQDAAPKPVSGGVDISADVEDTLHQLPPLPSPPLPTHPDFIHCTPPAIPTYRKFSIFTAGSIEMGRAIQWQRHLLSFLCDLPITVCNPRRGNWDVTVTPREKDEAFNLQVQWELSALEHVDVIAFFFDKATTSPVTMLELGLWAKSGKVVVCCDKEFHKAGNVHITCRRYGIDFVESFEEFVPLIKKMLEKKGMRLNEKNNVVDEEGREIENKGAVVTHINDVFTGIVVRGDDEVGKEKEKTAGVEPATGAAPEKGPKSEAKPEHTATSRSNELKTAGTPKKRKFSAIIGKIKGDR